MNQLLRPYLRFPSQLAIVTVAACLLFTPPATHAQALNLTSIFGDANPLLTASAPGYLGVDLADVDAGKAQALKLKEVRGAVITLIDHDAPAGQIGLKVNDVVLAINGQNVEGAEQLRRMLREIPPGRKISLEISRDGNIQTLAVQLVDRKAMEHDIWNKIGIDADGIAPLPPTPAMGMMGGAGDAPIPGGFHMPFFGSSLNVGALVEPLTSQMAEYFGVQGGLMVKQVAKKSEASTAGLKAFDVILKLGNDNIATAADWERALRSNRGKPVQVTILRDRKQQTLTLQVDSKHRGALEYEDLFGPGNDLVAGLSPLFDSGLAQALFAQSAADEESMRRQAQQFEDQMRRQMDAWRKNFNPEQVKQFQQQMEQFRQQMQQWCQQNSHHFV